MAFPDEPLAVEALLQIDGTWTDVTESVYTRDSIDISYGRADEGSRIDPGKCSLTLNNRDGRFSNRNPMSPLFGKVGRNTPVQISVPGPSYLKGTGGSVGAAGISTPDAASLDITGDIDIRIDAALRNWITAGVTATTELAGKFRQATNQRSWLLMMRDGKPRLEWSTAGTATIGVNATSILTVPVSLRVALRVTLDVDNGAGGSTVTFYTAPTIAGPWVQLGAPVVTAGITSIFNSTAELRVGDAGSDLGFQAVNGKVHSFELRNGIGGTVVANPDFTVQTPGAAAFNDRLGLTWTIGATASIDNMWLRHTGEISSWPQRWDTAGADVWTPVTASGIMRRLGQGAKALDSTLRRRIPSGAPLAYWPMEEAQGTTQAYSPIQGVAPLKTTGMTFAAVDTLAGSGPLPTLGSKASLTARPPRGAAGAWHIEMVYNLPALPATAATLLRVDLAGGSIAYALVKVATTGITLQLYDSADALLNTFTVTLQESLDAFVNTWNRLQLFTYTTGGTAYVTVGWRNVVTGSWYYTFTSTAGTHGAVSSITGSWADPFNGLGIGHLSVFPTGGSSQTVPAVTIYDSADTGFAGESALTRIARISDEEGVPRNTIDGDSTLSAAAMGPQKPGAFLSLLQECADTDRGILYEDRAVLGVMYRDRTSLYNQTPALVLDYTAPGEVMPPLEPVDDDQAVRNDCTVTREGGSSARVVADDGPLSVLPPPDGVGTYDESVTLSLRDDNQPEQQASWSVHMGTWDEARYPTVKISLHAAPHLIPAVLELELGDVIRITNTPDWLPPGPVDLMIQGVTETIDVYTWDIVFNCTPAGPWTIGVTDDPVVGRADTDGSHLAAAVSATDTVLPVAVTDGPAWITAAPNVIADPGFETGTGDWAGTRGTGNAVVTHETGIVHSGTGALRITRVHPTDTGTMNIGDGSYPAAPGQTWAGRVWVYAGPNTAGAQAMRVAVVWDDSAGTDTLIYGTAVTVQPGSWQLLTVTATLPTGAVAVHLNVEGRSGWTVGQYWIADDVRLANTDLVDDNGDDFPFDVRVGGEVMRVHGIGPSINDTFVRAAPVPTATDTFGRTSSSGWGTTTTGAKTWSNSGGASTDYTVASGTGKISAGVVNSSRFTLLPALSLANVDVQADITVPVVASGASISTGLRLRAADTSNYYYIECVRSSATDISVLLVSRVAGSSTTIAGPVSKGTYAAGDTWTVRARLVGHVLQAKLWKTSGTEPSVWDVQGVTTSLPNAGPVGTRMILSTGNTNTLPVVSSWDNIRVTEVLTGWGTSTSGHAWTTDTGDDTEYTVDGGKGLIALASVGSSRRIVAGPDLVDTDIRAAMTITVIPDTDSLDLAVMSRYQDSSNYYIGVLHCHNVANADVRLRKVVAGVYTTMVISDLLPGTYAVGDTYWLRFQTIGSLLRARAWKDGATEPTTWNASTTDTDFTTAGPVGVRANLQENNLNPLPVIVPVTRFDLLAPQGMTVARSVNGIVKAQTAGTDLRLATPTTVAL